MSKTPVKCSFGRVFWKIISAIGLFLLIFPILTSVFVLIVRYFFPEIPLEGSWQGMFIGSSGMLIFSICLIFILSRGKISSYGFRKAVNLKIVKYMLLAAGLSLLSNLIMFLFVSKQPSLIGYLNVFQSIILLWIYIPIIVEIFFRGLIQTYLKVLDCYGFTCCKIRISLPVLITSIMFSLYHLTLFFSGQVRALSTIIIIIISTFFLGLMAGYYREKTKSLIPGMIILMVFNAVGILMEWLFI